MVFKTEEQRLKYNQYQNKYRKDKKLCEVCDKMISCGKFYDHLKTKTHNLIQELQKYKKNITL